MEPDAPVSNTLFFFVDIGYLPYAAIKHESTFLDYITALP
jgi:hypothetical protein